MRGRCLDSSTSSQGRGTKSSQKKYLMPRSQRVSLCVWGCVCPFSFTPTFVCALLCVCTQYLLTHEREPRYRRLYNASVTGLLSQLLVVTPKFSYVSERVNGGLTHKMDHLVFSSPIFPSLILFLV